MKPSDGCYPRFPALLRRPYRMLQRLLVLEGVSVLVADTADVQKTTEPCVASLVSAHDLRRFLSQGDAPYCEELAERIGDDKLACFGVESDGKLLSFAWFHVGSAEPEMNYGYCQATSTPMRLEDDAAFVFHAYTHPRARGQRLMTHVLSGAANWLAEHRGVRRLVGTTELINDAARQAFANACFTHTAAYWRLGACRWAAGWYPEPASPVLRYGG